MPGRYTGSGLALMAVPLYLGPLLAGWAQAPWPVPLAIAAMFFLMQVLRGVEPAGAGSSPVAALAVLALVQVAVVGSVCAIGALLALATGPLALPPWLPLALSFAGAAVGVLRHRRNPREDELWEVIDKAIDALETGAPVDFGDEDFDAVGAGPDPEAEAAAQAALAALRNLPADAPLARIDAVARQLADRVRDRAWHALADAAGAGARAVDLAVLRYAAIPEVRAELVNAAELGLAMSVLLDSDDEEVLSELASLTATLLDEGAPASELPPPGELRDKAERFAVLAPLVARVEAEYDKWQAAFA